MHKLIATQPLGTILQVMNMMVPKRAKMQVEVVHDLVCPWCYLGFKRLLRTLAARPDILAELIWRPFLLNPDMPRAGMTRADYVARKFGGEERAKRLYASIADIGIAEGIPFRFERIRRTPSSIDAHRLVRWADAHGRGTQMVDALFAAHFCDGRDIGDWQVLISIAGACGLDAMAAHAFLHSDAEVDAIHAENLRAHRLGINGVPCFVIAGRHAIAGAQEPEVMERLLDIAVVESEEL